MKARLRIDHLFSLSIWFLVSSCSALWMVTSTSDAIKCTLVGTCTKNFMKNY